MNSPLVDLARQGRLIRKELRESLRDRRTILTLVLTPLLLYPILAMAFQQLILSNRVEKDATTYRVGFVSEAEAGSLLPYLDKGRRYLEARHRGKAHSPHPPAYLEPMPTLSPHVVSDPDDTLRHGLIDVVVRLEPPG